jgi:TnpA family transposase
VLDGLLYHKSSLVINEHYADTGGFSDHVFAMCHLLGFRFAPRIRDLKEKRLYILPGMTVPPELAPLVAGAINLRALSDHWIELLRLACIVGECSIVPESSVRRGSRRGGLARP